jgi:hypothetical protein
MEKSAIEFEMAYQRASSYANSKEGSEVSAAELTKRTDEAREKIDNIFIAIREDVRPTEPYFKFQSLIRREQLQS